MPWPGRLRSLVPDRRGLLVFGRCVLAGVCIAASIPPWGWWPLAFVGIAIADRLIAGHGWARRFRRMWMVAAAWLAPGMIWMWDFTAPGYVVAVAIFAAFFGVAAALCPPGRARWIALPALITLAEMARWRFPFGGEPLATLAMSQADAPLGQTARLAGSYLLVAFVVLGGVALSAAWERDWKVSGGIVLGLVAVGLLAAVAPRGHDVSHLRVAVVQGGGPQHTRAEDTDNWVVFQREVKATEMIKGPVDLVLWPEDVVGLEGTLDQNPHYKDELSRLARQLHTTMVVGVTEDVSPTHFRNAAVVFNPDGSVGDRFDKVRRVPFGEYVPFRSLVEKLAGANSGLPDRDAIAGTKPAVLHTQVGTLGRGDLVGGLLRRPRPRRDQPRRLGPVEPDQRVVLLARRAAEPAAGVIAAAGHRDRALDAAVGPDRLLGHRHPRRPCHPAPGHQPPGSADPDDRRAPGSDLGHRRGPVAGPGPLARRGGAGMGADDAATASRGRPATRLGLRLGSRGRRWNRARRPRRCG